MGVVIVERPHGDGKGRSYQVRWNRRRNDRPRCVHLGTHPLRKLAEAQQLEAQFMLSRTGEVDVDALRRRTGNTVADLAKAWIESEHTAEEGMATKRAYADRISARWGTRAPGAIRQVDVQGWIDDLVKAGLSVGTIQNHLNVLRPLLRHGEVDPIWLRGYKQLNLPTEAWEAMDLPDRIRREAVRAHLTEGHGPTPPASPERQAIFDMIEHGGLRTDEACGLRWRQVEATRLINVGTKHVGKKKKPPRHIAYLPVLGGRPVPMWIPAKPEGVNPDDLVFGVTDDTFTRAVKAAARRAGVQAFIPKSLRHLHATRLCVYRTEHGMSDYDMARRMGHRKSEFVDNYSDHPLPDPD